jgi:hypothetical protein
MRETEFGEELVLRPLFDALGIRSGYFIDIGAGGQYSNTDWLVAEGWGGAQFDSLAGVVEFGPQLMPEEFSPQVRRENVSSIIRWGRGIDFLSTDIDGMDYWIVDEFLWKGARPQVVMVEYNRDLPRQSPIPTYNPEYIWDGKTKTFGCDWTALDELMGRYGYALVFKNTANCIFVLDKPGHWLKLKRTPAAKDIG